MIQIRSVDSFEANVIGTRNDIVRYYENFPGATFRSTFSLFYELDADYIRRK